MTDWKLLPSLTALRAFGAMAETGSVVAAGEQLNVSHAAISQQIKALERHMGLSLVDRTGRALSLTSEGRQLADALNAGFGTIAKTVVALTGSDRARPLHVTATPMLASAWLMPQLAGFHAAHPGTDLVLSATPEVQAIEPGGIDLGLRYGDGNWPGLDAELMFASPTVVVAAPSLVGDGPYLQTTDLAEFPWLQDTGVSESTDWFYECCDLNGRSGGLVRLPGNLVLDGARDGQGVIVAVRAFVEKDVQAGRLRALFQREDNKGYYIVTRPGVQREAARNFIKWLRRTVRSDQTTTSTDASPPISV